MDKIKIAFFDIDGTLIDMERKEISEKMLETLKDLQKNGIKICIATGRAPMAIPKFEGVEFDAFLAYNGSYCYDKDGMILDHCCLLYTSPSPRDLSTSRMPSSA